jgi:hypothetical protein
MGNSIFPRALARLRLRRQPVPVPRCKVLPLCMRLEAIVECFAAAMRADVAGSICVLHLIRQLPQPKMQHFEGLHPMHCSTVVPWSVAYSQVLAAVHPEL